MSATKTVKFPCHVCQQDIGWDAPSGVCGVTCFNTGQRFDEMPEDELTVRAAAFKRALRAGKITASKLASTLVGWAHAKVCSQDQAVRILEMAMN